MDAMIAFGIFGAVVVAIVGAILAVQHFEKKRSEKIQKAATEMGLSFSATGDPDLQSRLSPVAHFGLGRNRQLTNLMYGETDECRISIFDYRYTTGSGKHQHTTKVTVVFLESARLKLPVFSLRPENLFDKIGGLLGFQDIDFPDHPLFSQRFVLKGPEEEPIRKFFTPKLLDYFAGRTNLCVEALPGMMAYYIPGQRRKPEDFPLLLEEAYKIFGVIVDP